MQFLSSLENLLYDACIILHQGIDNFETELGTHTFFGQGYSSPLTSTNVELNTSQIQKFNKRLETANLWVSYISSNSCDTRNYSKSQIYQGANNTQHCLL